MMEISAKETIPADALLLTRTPFIAGVLPLLLTCQDLVSGALTGLLFSLTFWIGSGLLSWHRECPVTHRAILAIVLSATVTGLGLLLLEALFYSAVFPLKHGLTLIAVNYLLLEELRYVGWQAPTLRRRGNVTVAVIIITLVIGASKQLLAPVLPIFATPAGSFALFGFSLALFQYYQSMKASHSFLGKVENKT